jgi:hypothetical protein
MEGRSGAPRADAASLVRNTDVAEPDVVVEGGGSHRGAAASGGLVVKAADEEELEFGDATMPGLNVLPAGDPPVCDVLSTHHLLHPSLVVIRIRSNRTTDEP